MIRALESAEIWRPTCSECTDALRKRRGCKKPGFDMKLEGQPFRFTSPAVADTILYECPTGYLFREAPHIFATIEASSSLENASPTDLRQVSTYLLHAGRVVRAEKARLRELRSVNDQASADSAYGQRIRSSL